MKLPNRSDIRKQYYLKDGDKWQDNYWNERKNMPYLRKIKEIVDNEKLDSIIDVGAGPIFFVERFDVKKKAVLDIKKWDIYDELNNTEVIIADIYDIPLSDNSYDCVICAQVLEHLGDPKKACDELKRICKKMLIISVPYKLENMDPSDIQHNIDLDKLKSWIGEFDKYFVVEDRIIVVERFEV